MKIDYYKAANLQAYKMQIIENQIRIDEALDDLKKCLNSLDRLKSPNRINDSRKIKIQSVISSLQNELRDFF